MLVGVVADVSDTMESVTGDGAEEYQEKWAESAIQVVDDLIKHDLSGSNHIFAIGVGARCRNRVFDVMRTLEQFQKIDDLSFEQTIDEILQILKNAGASYVQDCAKKDTIKQVVLEKIANLVLRKLKSNNDFVKKFVNDFLPEICKTGIKYKKVAYVGLLPSIAFGGLIAAALYGVTVLLTEQFAESVVSKIRPATTDEIKEVVEKAKTYLLDKDKIVKSVKVRSAFFSVKDAQRIIHGCIDEDELTESRRKELLGTIEPYIYGSTPLYEALRMTHQLFLSDPYGSHTKLMFILSDGMPTDAFIEKTLWDLEPKDRDVWVVSCFIDHIADVEQKRLYSRIDDNWDVGAKFLFELSSKLPTQLVPRTIFIKRGWKIDFINNETRLFLQVNHPDHIKDACDLAKKVVCCQDALAYILGYVDLHIYINQSNNTFPAPDQEGDTCYANASAAVVHLATKRILGRKGGYPDFHELRQDIIMRFSRKGANTLTVLEEVCPKYRLHCQVVDIVGALCAVTNNRPVVATFRLSKREWNIFNEFFNEHPTGIISSKEINVKKRHQKEKTDGHAVILTSFNSESLRFMNTWGIEWGDQGFFRVQQTEILDFTFIDVFWKQDDLFGPEKAYYAQHGSEVAERLMKTLKGLQSSKYKCPLCCKRSLVTEFTGSLLQSRCPKCLRKFKSDDRGNILALNMYLTSISK